MSLTGTTIAVQVFDGYLVKYGATVVALLTYAAPLYLRRGTSTASRDDLTQDYIRAMRLLQNTSRCGLGLCLCICGTAPPTRTVLSHSADWAAAAW